MAEKVVFKVVQTPTSGNWKIERSDEDTPLLFVDSKEDAVRQAKKMAEEHGGKVVTVGEKAKTKSKAKPKPKSKKKAA